MIVIVHSLYMLLTYYLKLIKNRKCMEEFANLQLIHEKVNLQNCEGGDVEEKLVFDPPVYKQRYGEIQKLLIDNIWLSEVEKVVDFGCAEFGLFQFIKRLYRIQEILEVDIDQELLTENLFRIQPCTIDYLKRRTEPLVVQVFSGSISDPDKRLLGADVVIGIEIIEHLFPDTLDALPYNIFGYIRPKLAVFTTPNADFNEVIPNFKSSRRFRHHDHKFEWSREQFESWAENIVSRFPEYSVTFQGVGVGPAGSEPFGCCSQMCVFTRRIDLGNITTDTHVEGSVNLLSKTCRCKRCIPSASFGVCTHCSWTNALWNTLKTNVLSDGDKEINDKLDEYYKLVTRIEYPFEVDNRTPEEKILDQLKYRICLMSNVNGRFYNEDSNRLEIPIIELLFNELSHFTTIAEACNILKQAGYDVEECNINEQLETCVVYEPEMDAGSSPPASRSSSPSPQLHDTSKDNSDWSTITTEADLTDCWDTSENQPGSFITEQPNEAEQEQQITTTCLDMYLERDSMDYGWHEADALENVNQIVNNIISCVEYPNDQREFVNGKGNEDENYGAVMSAMYDSGYQKSSTNLTTSTHSCSDQLDVDVLDDQLIRPDDESENITKLSGSNNSSDERYVIPEYKTDVILDIVKDQNCYEVKNSTGGVLKRLNASSHQPSKDNIPGTSTVKKKKKRRCHEDDDDDCSGVLDKNDEGGRKVRENEGERKINPPIILALPLINEPVPVVENGDLANNNRDVEGNNYPNAQLNHAIGGNDNDENVVLQHVNGEVARNEDDENRNAVAEEDEDAVGGGENIKADDRREAIEIEIEFASREALFDPNSEIDLLEDFNGGPMVVPLLPGIEDIENAGESVHNVVLIGVSVQPIGNDVGPVLPLNADPFPNWLLHLLGNEVVDEEEQPHNEPHFYCQGDGIGVHPSYIEEDFEEDHSSTENTSSDSTTDDNAESEQTVSEVEVVSLPDDNNDVPTEQNIETAAAVDAESAVVNPVTVTAGINTAASSSGAESADEYYDTLDESLSLNSNRSGKFTSVNNEISNKK